MSGEYCCPQCGKQRRPGSPENFSDNPNRQVLEYDCGSVIVITSDDSGRNMPKYDFRCFGREEPYVPSKIFSR